VPTILGDLRFDAREFRDLMPLRFGIVTEQERTTLLTGGRAHINHPLDLAQRFERAGVSGMTGLPTGFSTGGWAW
jgi:hypothetical protein